MGNFKFFIPFLLSSLLVGCSQSNNDPGSTPGEKDSQEKNSLFEQSSSITNVDFSIQTQSLKITVGNSSDALFEKIHQDSDIELSVKKAVQMAKDKYLNQGVSGRGLIKNPSIITKVCTKEIPSRDFVEKLMDPTQTRIFSGVFKAINNTTATVDKMVKSKTLISIVGEKTGEEYVRLTTKKLDFGTRTIEQKIKGSGIISNKEEKLCVVSKIIDADYIINNVKYNLKKAKAVEDKESYEMVILIDGKIERFSYPRDQKALLEIFKTKLNSNDILWNEFKINKHSFPSGLKKSDFASINPSLTRFVLISSKENTKTFIGGNSYLITKLEVSDMISDTPREIKDLVIKGNKNPIVIDKVTHGMELTLKVKLMEKLVKDVSFSRLESAEYCPYNDETGSNECIGTHSDKCLVDLVALEKGSEWEAIKTMNSKAVILKVGKGQRSVFHTQAKPYTATYKIVVDYNDIENGKLIINFKNKLKAKTEVDYRKIKFTPLQKEYLCIQRSRELRLTKDVKQMYIIGVEGK